MEARDRSRGKKHPGRRLAGAKSRLFENLNNILLYFLSRARAAQVAGTSRSYVCAYVGRHKSSRALWEREKSTILKLSIKHSTKRFARTFRVATEPSIVASLPPAVLLVLLLLLFLLFLPSLLILLSSMNLLKYVKSCNLFNLHSHAPRSGCRSSR